MKTGKLLKFQRAGVDIQAYLYQDEGTVRACLYVLPDEGRGADPTHVIAGASEATVEAEVRAWIDSHFPRPR